MTYFDSGRFEASHQAHLKAQDQFYRRFLFPGLEITFEDVTKTVEDLEYAIDVCVSVSTPGFRGPFKYAVQERWRADLKAMNYKDITVTSWNLETDLPSELHKLGAHLFVYGFHDSDHNIIEAVAVDVPRMLYALTRENLSYRKQNRWMRSGGADQEFLGIGYKELEEVGAIICGPIKCQEAAA
jgi:hypothetical protein